MLAALISCHGKNIIHRDIKDDNIFVSPEGVYKLGDFGVSKALNDKSRAESVKGTPNFIAPEVYLGKETYDNTVDLYSLGIVLYKLLNKSRNPFMPMFPQPYSTADEDTAFEQRMRGEIPELPLDAQNELGKVVLKAIMPRAERYNNAQEFLGALQKAEQILSAEELNMKVNVIVTRAQDISKEQSVAMEGKASLKTIGDDMYLTEDEESTPAEDRHLFDTMGTFYPEPNNVSSETFDPKKEVVRETEETEQTYGKGEKSNFSYNVDEKSIVPPQVAAVDKKDFRWLIYLTPVLIAAIYIVVFLIVIPKTYGKAISVIEWMFSGPENIIETLTVPDNVLNPIYKIIGFKVINWILSGAFVVSLFAVGYMLQNTKPKVSLDAKLTGKSAYLTVMDLYEQVKLITGQDTSGAKKALYSLCERLKNESDFGTGSVAVINCENEIAAFLSAIQGNISGLNNPSTAPETNKNIEILCQRIQAKLKMRIELKKR
ncbi:MAG: hypothetical protein E7260_09645 [Lachnospiraceae bacterium]|nr:hypothetical protein [Lachnospiraceae bacterium]